MFADPGCHRPEGAYQSVFSLAVHPDFQRRGYGRLLMDELIGQALREGREAVILTSREKRLAYYQSFGFEKQEVQSAHGGVPWFAMTLRL